jgi:hypothetical protein
LEEDGERDDCHQRQHEHESKNRNRYIQRTNEGGKQTNFFTGAKSEVKRAWLANDICHRRLHCVALNGHAAKNSSSLCLFREFVYYRSIVCWGKSMMLKRNLAYGEGHAAMRAMSSAFARM